MFLFLFGSVHIYRCIQSTVALRTTCQQQEFQYECGDPDDNVADKDGADNDADDYCPGAGDGVMGACSYYSCYSGGDGHRAAAALVMVIEAAAGAAGGWRWWQRWRLR